MVSMNTGNAALWSQFEGQSIENTYRLNRLIGVGGFAGVFDADHIVEDRLLRRVAVKLILADSESKQRQLDELVAATMLQHPHVLRCFHAGSALVVRSKLLYLVMEIAEGSLQSCLARGVLSLREASIMTEQVASAIAYVHRQNLVHRDVKSANVLLVGGEWKLSDFGTIRQSLGPATSHTMGVIGTVGYMPPESFEGTVSAAWDIWSLGVLVLECLTGKGPFPHTPLNQLIGTIMQKTPSIPAGLPEPFGEIVRHCLARNHRERWSAQQVVEELKRSEGVKVRELLARAQSHRAGGRWKEALQILREGQQFDAASAEIPRLIVEIERQMQDFELQPDLKELRSRDALNRGDTTARHQIGEILGHRSGEGPKREMSDAIGQGDFRQASRRTVAPSPRQTIEEHPSRTQPLWKLLAKLATAAVGAIILMIWITHTSSHITVGRDEVRYQGTATQQEAEALGAALKTSGYFQDRGVSVILSKGSEGTVISYVVKDGFWDDPTHVQGFADLTRALASTVGGLPIKVRLVNRAVETKKEIPVA
jgi:serine/threonine protein kinase